jgi:hypothetical protein
MKRTKICILLFLALGIENQANALEVGLLGGLNFWNPSVSPSAGATTVTSTSGDVAFGAFIKKDLNLLFDLEVDAIYMRKKNTLVYGGSFSGLGTVSLEMSSVMIPVLIRTSFFPGGFLNLGAGAYYEAGTNRGVVTNGSPGTYSGSSLNHSDLGLIGSAQVRLPIFPLVHAIVDARILHGLQEQSTDTSSQTVKNNSIQAFAGLSVGI